jgi:transposase
LEPIVARISELTIEIRHALQAHPDGRTFRSLFIAPDSWLCAATMLAEIGDCRDRYPTYRTLAADAGQAPVAVESGKAKHAQFRWACDHRLRDAFDTLADASRRHNPWAADIYDQARARGASHAHAARILGRAWCQIMAPLARPRHLRPQPTHHQTTPHRFGELTLVGPPGPTSPPPSDGSAPPSAQAARRAERVALDGKPTDATQTPMDDTGGLVAAL